MAIDRTSLIAKLTNTGARWTTSPSGPIVPHRLGYDPGPDEHSLQTREMLATASYKHFRATAAAPPAIAAPALPPQFDWRAATRPGLPAGDYVTPIRDQSTCGSCVSFGSIAAMESAIAIKSATSNPILDLSEAFLFFCHYGVSGGTCDLGWSVNPALTSLLGTGTPDQPCFPYTPLQQPCNPCPDWTARVTKLTAWHPIASTDSMKDWLANHGPLVTCFSVYEDFDAYTSGVYHYTSGVYRGGHCVCCIGYSDIEDAWICKNSWGTGWGESGFFRIGYGECGIDAMMWAVEV